MDSKSSKSSSFLLAAARLAAETDRADAAERQVADSLAQIRLLHQDKLQLRAELAKSHQELQLWKVQLDLAQKEILRAQTVVDQVDRARADAEERAHRYRQRVRELVEERSIQVAMDEGRRRGFEEGLEAGRRNQIRYPMPVYPVPKPRLTPRPPSRRETSSQSVPVPPAPISAPTPVAPAPQRPVTDPEPRHSPPPEEIHSPRPVADQPIHPIPVHNGVEVVHDTFDVPPDNFIPVIREGEGGIALPPPHEWVSRPRSDSQLSATRPHSESRASVKSGVRPRSDSRTAIVVRSPPPLSPVRESSFHSHSRPSAPRSKTPSILSHQSSHLSQFDFVSPPPPPSERGSESTKKPNRMSMTQPEQIADEWRSRNSNILTPTPSSRAGRDHHQGDSSPSDDIIPRPMSSEPLRSVHPKPKPPQRPNTTDPTRSRTPKPRNIKTRQSVQPVPISSVFHDENNPSASGDWLRSHFTKQRSVSNVTLPNIDVEPPSESPTNTERTAVDPVLLTPEDADRPTPLPPPTSDHHYQQRQQHDHDTTADTDSSYLDTPSSMVAPTSTTSYTLYAKPPPESLKQYSNIAANPSYPMTNEKQYITGILPNDKILPPGFIPLSPIPSLSNLTPIPESPPISDHSAKTTTTTTTTTKTKTATNSNKIKAKAVPRKSILINAQSASPPHHHQRHELVERPSNPTLGPIYTTSTTTATAAVANNTMTPTEYNNSSVPGPGFGLGNNSLRQPPLNHTSRYPLNGHGHGAYDHQIRNANQLYASAAPPDIMVMRAEGVQEGMAPVGVRGEDLQQATESQPPGLARQDDTLQHMGVVPSSISRIVLREERPSPAPLDRPLSIFSDM